MMKVVAAAVLAAALLSVAQADARDRAAAPAGTRWVELQLDEIAAHRTNPPRAARGLALLSVAIQNASRVRREHRSAAVAGSASTVLAYLYPDRADAFEELAARSRPRLVRARSRRPGTGTRSRSS